MAQLWIVTDRPIDFSIWEDRINDIYGGLFGLDKIEVIYSPSDPNRFSFFLFSDSPALDIDIDEIELAEFVSMTDCQAVIDNHQFRHCYYACFASSDVLFAAQLLTLLPFPHGCLVNHECKTIDLEKLSPVPNSIIVQRMWREPGGVIDIADSPEFWHSL